MSQKIRFFIDFKKDTVDVINARPKKGAALIGRLQERLSGGDSGALNGLYEHSEFSPDVPIINDLPEALALAAAMSKALARYNDFMDTHRTRGVRPLRFAEEPDDRDSSKEGGGSQGGPEPNCIQVITKPGRTGEIQCVEYNYVLHVADDDGRPETRGFEDYEMDRIDDDTPAIGKWQAKFIYDL